MKSAIKTTLTGSLSARAARKDWVKPPEWPDISKTSAGNIRLLVSDIYPKFSFFVDNASAAYDIYVNGAFYRAVSGKEIVLLDLTALEGGKRVMYPIESILHLIELRTKNNPVSEFKLYPVAGQMEQGLLWVDFGFSRVSAGRMFWETNSYTPCLEAITATNNLLSSSTFSGFIYKSRLKTLPVLSDALSGYAFDKGLSDEIIKKVELKNISSNVNHFVFFSDCISLRSVKLTDCNFNGVRTYSNTHRNNLALIEIPAYSYNSAENMSNFITNAVCLKPCVLDLSYAVNLKIIGAYGTVQTPMRGLKGLKINSSAPFTGASPQINVSYTGFEREALQELFEALPFVSAGQIINITGASGAAALSKEDIDVAVSKGWTVLR